MLSPTRSPASANQAKVANAFKELATYEGKLYGTGFLPDVSILLWNKGLFKQAGLDPEKPPQTLDEVYEYAKKICAIGPDTYGYYFSGNCGGCNIFTQADGTSQWQLSEQTVSAQAATVRKHKTPNARDGSALKERVRRVVGHMRSSQMWCFALRGRALRRLIAAAGVRGVRCDWYREGGNLFSGYNGAANSANCTLFNGPPSSLVTAARRKGYARGAALRHLARRPRTRGLVCLSPRRSVHRQN